MFVEQDQAERNKINSYCARDHMKRKLFQWISISNKTRKRNDIHQMVKNASIQCISLKICFAYGDYV